MSAQIKVTHLIVVCNALAINACGFDGAPSQTIPTEEIIADIHLTAQSNKPEVEFSVRLYHREINKESVLDLSKGDKLVASSDALYSVTRHGDHLFDNLNYSLDTNQLLVRAFKHKSPLLGGASFEETPWYTASFEKIHFDKPYILSFERGEGSEFANTLVELPSLIAITAPQAGQAIAVSSEWRVQWDTVVLGQGVDVLVEQYCVGDILPIHVWQKSADATELTAATIVVPGATFSVSDSDACSMTITLQRNRDAVLSNRFLAGQAIAHVRDSLNVAMSK